MPAHELGRNAAVPACRYGVDPPRRSRSCSAWAPMRRSQRCTGLRRCTWRAGSGPVLYIGCAALRLLFLFLGPSPRPGHSTGRGTVRWHLPASGHAKPSGPCGRVATGRWCEQPTGDCQDADRRARAVKPTFQEPQHASHICMLAGRPSRARPCPPVPARARSKRPSTAVSPYVNEPSGSAG